MTIEQWLLVGIILASTLLYVTQWLKTEVTALLTIVALAITGILTPDQALSGFSSGALVTVAAMFVLSGGLLKTGAMEAAVIFLGRYAHGSPRRLLAAVGASAATTSAFVNNTPVVVMMMPVLLALSRRTGLRASKLLIPLSYFAILGGTITLIGTSTNILLDDLYRKAGGPGFGLFDFTPLGIVYVIVGGLYVIFVGYRLLPENTALADLTAPLPENRYVTEAVVAAGSTIVGRPVRDVVEAAGTLPPRSAGTTLQHRRIENAKGRVSLAAEASKSGVLLLQLVREETTYRGEALAGLAFAPDDAMLLAGTAGEIKRFLERTRTQLGSVLQDERRVLLDDIEQQIVEAVVLPGSPYEGRPMGELGLYQDYGVSILGLQHDGRQLLSGLRSRRLSAGDLLLLQGEGKGLRRMSEWGRLMLITGVEENLVRSAKNRVALLIMLGVVLLGAMTQWPISILALGGAVLMILLRCLRLDEALRALDSGTLFMMAGSIPLGIAMETTGLAQIIVDTLLDIAAQASPIIFISLFYLLTSLLTEILSNNAVAVLMTPIAYSLAITLGIDARPLLVAVAFGASASFMTPIGYQTNAIVMGPGGYTFRDYLRIGVPLNMLLWAVASLLIPIFYPP
jgi:di/tricarboxylate transporter